MQRAPVAMLDADPSKRGEYVALCLRHGRFNAEAQVKQSSNYAEHTKKAKRHNKFMTSAGVSIALQTMLSLISLLSFPLLSFVPSPCLSALSFALLLSLFLVIDVAYSFLI